MIINNEIASSLQTKDKVEVFFLSFDIQFEDQQQRNVNFCLGLLPQPANVSA